MSPAVVAGLTLLCVLVPWAGLYLGWGDLLLIVQVLYVVLVRLGAYAVVVYLGLVLVYNDWSWWP